MAGAPTGRSEHRVAVVTGGSRGVGAEATDRLAGLEFAVVVNYAHDQRAAESIVDSLLSARRTAVAIRADVADELDMERLFTETTSMFGSIDAVVHTVRGHMFTERLTDVAISEFDAACRTSLRASLIVNRLAARHLRDGGAIVNVITTVGDRALAQYGTQAVLTAAIEELTRVLALELRERGIAVHAIPLEVDQPCTPGTTADLIVELVNEHT